MISRIDAINEIGTFRKQPPVDFFPLTLIHGPNGSGKSTLADIFRSLQENDSDIILKRKRIDVSARSGQPEVELSFLEEAASQRQVVRFGEGRWRRSEGDWVFEIFDTRFQMDCSRPFLGKERFVFHARDIFQFIAGRKFWDVRVNSDYSFSSGDMKTLAISGFFSCLRNRKQDDSLQRTIAVLDDPVSGLDDNRAGQVLQYLWRVAMSCRQTIILSHQRQFLANIRDKAISENTPFAMLRIDEQNGQSVIRVEAYEPSLKTTVSSDHEASRITEPISHGSWIQMVCLANSRKYGGRCIAGKEIAEDGKFAGRWLRPVSQEDWGTLSVRCITLQDGATPNLLDILTVPIQGRNPKHCQQENAVVDQTRAWRRKGSLPSDRLPALTDDVEALWINGWDSRHGLNDRIPQDVAESRVRSSLLFIQPAELRICVEEFVNSPLKVRVKFHFKNVEYGLTVTDPMVEFAYSQKPLGEYPVTQKDVYLCVSLGEPFEGYCYKLAAGFVNLAV